MTSSKSKPQLLLIIFLFLFLIPSIILAILLTQGIAVLGQILTAVMALTIIAFLIMIILGSKEIYFVMSKKTNKYSLILLVAIVLIFAIYVTKFFKPVEFLFPDDSRYQAIALNILNHGNSNLCLYGTGNLQKCFISRTYFDAPEWPFFIAVVFKIFGEKDNLIYSLELLFTILAILGIFSLSTLVTDKKEFGIIATVIFVLTPQVLLWTKVWGNANISFMAFTVIATFFFLLFMEKRSMITFLLSIFSTLAVIYIRTEGILLVLLFLLYYLIIDRKKVVGALKKGFNLTKAKQNAYIKYIIILCFAIILAEPAICLIYLTKPAVSSLAYAAVPNQTRRIISLSNFVQNIGPNISFLLGELNGLSYPYIFSITLTIFALIGFVYLLLRRKKSKQMLLILLLLIVYFVFYTAYFTNILTSTEVRFFLVVYPLMSILAAFGIVEIAGQFSLSEIKKYLTYVVLIAVFFAVPFLILSTSIASPTNIFYNGYPQILYSFTYNNKTVANIRDLTYVVYQNYSSVPENCLVLSMNPWIWYGVNRSAEYFPYVNATTKLADIHTTYSCVYADIEYGCPYNQSSFTDAMCKNIVYTRKPVDGLYGFLYNISNYS